MYGAEVDCVDHTLGEEFQPPSNFIEIKTQQELKDKNKKTNFRKYKLSNCSREHKVFAEIDLQFSF